MIEPRHEETENPGDKSDIEAGPPKTSPEPGAFYRSAWFFYLVLAIVGVLWLGTHHGELRLDLFLDPQRWWIDLGLGLASGLGLVLGWSLGRGVLAPFRDLEDRMRELIGPLDPSEVFALALISGFSEELLFRGAMQASWGWPWALLLFTLLHTGPGKSFRYWTLFALVAGGLFTWLTLSSGNLLAAMVAHVVVNGLNLYRLVGRLPPVEPS